MNALRSLFKDKEKKTIVNLAIAFAVGILLLAMSRDFFITKHNVSVGEPERQPAEAVPEPLEYERKLEKRLEEALSQAEGVGRVKVMITLRNGKEIFIGTDSVSSSASTKEVDAQGGSRETATQSSDSKAIIVADKNGVSSPLILKENEPQIEGVIIVAEGGDNVFVKDALTKAAGTVLGVEANKVQILKMK